MTDLNAPSRLSAHPEISLLTKTILRAKFKSDNFYLI